MILDGEVYDGGVQKREKKKERFYDIVGTCSLCCGRKTRTPICTYNGAYCREEYCPRANR